MVIRALVIPLMKSGEVTAIFGICNKAAAYTEADAGTASRIADCLWGIVTRKLAEQSEQRMQEQLQQSQKIELLGQLAGGIAHDFNNMLSVTLGYTEILLESIPETHPFFEGLEAIRRSTERSANLTSQLLSFARKQLRQMQVINVNEEVAVMLPILKSALGESIQCNCKPAIDAVRVWMDPTQFDQILTNLCLNARDAIGHSGTITIATGVKHVETSDIRSGFPCLLPGIYVSISVTDTGTGIKAHDLPHIFEPFYTTKEVGEGSGLGLSTVYGIAAKITVVSNAGQKREAAVRLRFICRDTQSRKVQQSTRRLSFTGKQQDQPFWLLRMNPISFNWSRGFLKIKDTGFSLQRMRKQPLPWSGTGSCLLSCLSAMLSCRE